MPSLRVIQARKRPGSGFRCQVIKNGPRQHPRTHYLRLSCRRDRSMVASLQYGGCIVRAFTVLIPLCLFVFLAVTSPALAQSSLPSCEPLPQLQEALEKESDWKLAPGETLAQLLAEHREMLTELISHYPREVEPHRRLILEIRWWADPTQLPPLLERYRQQRSENPDDPFALYLEGAALFHTDTSTSIQLLEAARAKAPNFAWPSLQLAEICFGGKRAARRKPLRISVLFLPPVPLRQIPWRRGCWQRPATSRSRRGWLPHCGFDYPGRRSQPA